MIKFLIFAQLVGFFLRIPVGFFLEDLDKKASFKAYWISWDPAYSLTNSVASLEGKPATDRACSVQVRELLFNPQARSLRLITHSAGGLPLSSL